MMDASVLVVDDEPAVGKVLAALLQQAGITAQRVTSGDAALAALSAAPHDVVITDLRMPGMDGMTLLREITRRWSEIHVIVLTAHGTVSTAVDAMKAGAADFLLKPFERDEVIYAVRKALGGARHAQIETTRGLASPEGFGGTSAAMRECHDLIARAAAGASTVLVRGESGTGKDLAAHAIHEQSARRGKPFVKVHCAAFPDTLLESELFGYEKGAFTGAACRKPGRVDLAQGGTLFLDEIGDVSPAVQVKLLQLLQDRCFERLGATETTRADVRFVSATHRDLEEMVAKGTFREDLFYRLNVVPIWIPPLRARPDDIPMLVSRFGEKFAAENGRPELVLDEGAMQELRAQPWPGNVRQLQNFVERLVVLLDGPAVSAADVRRELSRQPRFAHGARTEGAVSPVEPVEAPASDIEADTLADKRRSAEREAILTALRKSGDNRTIASRVLGVSRRTFYNKLREHGIG